MTIYLDLDECLIHSIPNRGGGKKNRHLLRLDGESYWVSERPIAKQIISECREIAITKILTTATREYTYTINSLLNFGFDTNHILAQEDYLSEVQCAYSKDWLLNMVNIDQQSVLIDNNQPTNNWATTKMKLLGISKDRYFQIREFTGKDSPKIEAEWQDIKRRILMFKT